MRRKALLENLQELFFSGKQLEDDHKLIDYGIPTNSTLHLYLQAIDMIKLLVYIPSTEKTLELEAKTHETVETIKLLIQGGILSDQFTLFSGGQLLEDNKTLASLDIQSESMLYLVLNPRDVVSVSVKMQSGEILKLKVMHTVQDLKAIVQSMAGFVAGSEDLTCAGSYLRIRRLWLVVTSRRTPFYILPWTFKVFVKDLCGKCHVLKVCKEGRVLDVKIKFSEERGAPLSDISLIFACRVLEDDLDLASYNVEKDSIIRKYLEKCLYFSGEP